MRKGCFVFGQDNTQKYVISILMLSAPSGFYFGDIFGGDVCFGARPAPAEQGELITHKRL